MSSGDGRMARLHWPALNRAMVYFVLAAGGGCSAAWVIHANVPLVWQQAQAFNWWLALPAVILTCANLALRFLRWQFFLRRAGVFLPVRQSAGIFVAGLAMLLTPAYAGEGVKTWLVRLARPRTTARAAGVVLAERLFDALALALVGSAALFVAGERTLSTVLFVSGIGTLALAGAGMVAPARLPALGWRHSVTAASGVAGTLGVALALSLLAWLAGTCTLVAVCAGARCGIGPAQAIGTYAASTLLGGVTLLPAGVGVVGTAILLRLEGYGVAEQTAVLAALFVRLFTVWLTAAIGVLGCWRLARRAGATPLRHVAGERERFDALAPVYADQLSPAAREQVVRRKVALMRDALAAAIAPSASTGFRLLDAGCGQGWYVRALAEHGFDVTGIDLSPEQARRARDELGAPFRLHSRAAGSMDTDASRLGTRDSLPAGHGRLAAASVSSLPFQAGTFDAAYVINVLHHLGSTGEQARALDELARVVRPGGLVFVHEISTVNPLYRLYMSYLFPLLKRIDLGTERWLDPRRPPHSADLGLQEVRCYTFLPDFTPGWLLSRMSGVEEWLERSALGRYGAHFTAVYVRRIESPPPAVDSRSTAKALVAA